MYDYLIQHPQIQPARKLTKDPDFYTKEVSHALNLSLSLSHTHTHTHTHLLSQVTFFSDDTRYAMGLPFYEKLIHAHTYKSKTGAKVYAIDGTVCAIVSSWSLYAEWVICSQLPAIQCGRGCGWAIILDHHQSDDIML